MPEQHDQRLLCPGCSYNVQERHPQPDAFRYLTINEMKTAGYRCQNIVCHIYIEEEQIFTEDTDTVSNRMNSSPALPWGICTDAGVRSLSLSLSFQSFSHTAVPHATVPSNTMPFNADSDTCDDDSCELDPIATDAKATDAKVTDNIKLGNQGSIPVAVAASSSKPNLRGSIRNAWTEDEKDILRAMKAEGHTWSQIAEVSCLSQAAWGKVGVLTAFVCLCRHCLVIRSAQSSRNGLLCPSVELARRLRARDRA